MLAAGFIDLVAEAQLAVRHRAFDTDPRDRGCVVTDWKRRPSRRLRRRAATAELHAEALAVLQGHDV
jgi:hypothetical protein